MDAPKCSRCANHPAMMASDRKPVVGGMPNAGQRMMLTQHLKRSGHPILALAGAVVGGLASAANYFLEEVHYQCPVCGDATSRTERKK